MPVPNEKRNLELLMLEVVFNKSFLINSEKKSLLIYYKKYFLIETRNIFKLKETYLPRRAFTKKYESFQFFADIFVNISKWKRLKNADAIYYQEKKFTFILIIFNFWREVTIFFCLLENLTFLGNECKR